MLPFIECSPILNLNQYPAVSILKDPLDSSNIFHAIAPGCYHGGGSYGYIEKIGGNAYKLIHPVTKEESDDGIPGQVDGKGRKYFRGQDKVLWDVMSIHGASQRLDKLPIGERVGLKHRGG